MRQLVYSVATSLDGFIAGPNGEIDWIDPNAGIDFRALHCRFDTMLMGRRTYEVASTRGDLLRQTGMQILVVSTTLDSAQQPGITILNTGLASAVHTLKTAPGKDIWLSGGGQLFRSLLTTGLVDSVQVAVFPVLLGAGTPLISQGRRAVLKLNEYQKLPSGVLLLTYQVTQADGA